MDKYLVRTSSTESLSNKRPAEDNIWSKPKRTANSGVITSQLTFSTSNRFKDLADDSDCGQTEATNSASGMRTRRIPPIVVETKEEWSHQAITTLINKFTTDFNLQYRRNGKVAIHCYTNESHRMVTEGLRKENVLFHTFSRKEERSYKVVIRGIPSEAIPYVRDELASLGFNDALVNPLKSSSAENKTMVCLPLLVQLPAGSDIVKFRQIKYLCSCVIKVERFKPKSTSGTQCYRCQHFGHASRNCNLQARCVKCTGMHATKECPKKERSSPAQCCNCEENHPANYRQCPARIVYLERLQKNKRGRRSQLMPAMNAEITPSPATPWEAPRQSRNLPRAASSISATSLEAPRQPSFQPRNTAYTRASSKATITTATKEVGAERETAASQPAAISLPDAATQEMLEILNVIKRIKTEFTSCATMMDKVILIMTHLHQYV